MVKRSSTNFAVMLLFLDLCLTQVALYLASVARRYLPFGLELGRAKTAYLPLGIYVTVGVLWTVIFTLLSVYDLRKNLRLVDQLQRVLVATTVATLVFAGALYLSYRDVPRLLFLYFFCIDLFLLVGWRALPRGMFRLVGKSSERRRRVLIAGAGQLGRDVALKLQQQEWTGLSVVGFLDDDPDKQGKELDGLPILGPVEHAPRIIEQRQVQEVIFALPLRAHRKLANVVIELQRLPVMVKVVPDFFDLAFFRATVTADDLGGIPLLNLRASAIEGFPRLVKRVFDVVGATLLTILLSPVMLIIAISIKMDSAGPVIFKQIRAGENCESFYIYKFRSMVADAEERLHEVITETDNGQVTYKARDDPRVTRTGRLLRRTSLDELPQLFNVLKGEMSLVGPRPELPALVERYDTWQRQRFAVPPGVTGWWQISGRSERAMHQHVQDDLYYIQNYSLLLDLHILWKTIGVVLKGRGAY